MFGFKNPVKEAIHAARKALTKDQPREALACLNRILPHHPYSLDTKVFLSLIKALLPIGSRIAGPEFQLLLRPVLANPNDPPALFQLGFDLLEYGVPRFAVLVLYRLHVAIPNDERVLLELATALEAIRESEEVVRLVREAECRGVRDFMCSYMGTFHEVLCGQLEMARDHLNQLATLATEDDLEHLGRIKEMLARASALAQVTELDAYDLAGWHFVKMGAILTHLNPNDRHDLKGRFPTLEDTSWRIRLGIDRAMEIFKTWQVNIPKVLYARDQSSRIYAKALAALLNVPHQPLHLAEGPGLIACYDLSLLEGDDIERLNHYQIGRPLLVHAVNYVVTPMVSPDILTLLCQGIKPPWSADLETTFGRQSENEDTPHLQAILKAEIPPDLPDARPSWIETARPYASFFRTEGLRERYYQGGPAKTQTPL